MKRYIAGVVLLLPIIAPSTARACESGQGSGIEINATTKQVTYYCVDIPTPSQTQLEAEARQRIEQTLVEQAKNNRVTQIAESSIDVSSVDEPTVRPTIVEINATTGQVVERPYSDDELIQWRLDQASYLAKLKAREKAKDNATLGVNSCVNWSAYYLSGTQCHYDSIIISQEEIGNQYNDLYALWSPDWFEMLLSWLR